MQNNRAAKIRWWLDAFGKHSMNEFSGLGVSERKLTTGGEISPGPAHKGVLSVRRRRIDVTKVIQSH